MTPREKAYLLYTTYRFAMADLNANNDVNNDNIAKQCALISVNEMEKVERNVLLKFNLIHEDMVMHYWQLVKQEIEKL